MCLPENYQMKYYIYHILLWPNITFLAVVLTHRNIGLATKLMTAAQNAMASLALSMHVSIHVRRSNHAAFNLHAWLQDPRRELKAKYYADGEDAYEIRKKHKGRQISHSPRHNHHHQHASRRCSSGEVVLPATNSGASGSSSDGIFLGDLARSKIEVIFCVITGWFCAYIVWMSPE
ncbi:peptide alpha-N-acetyltransferase [Apostasia shenzhenica]|uniref:Peptide alpha-N-acetyltransferase n=1 Tax=Apostasia shenzhenica TaxID=1088818 RepID=A0A2I0A945_9ASPA|nr:peptide alpha-N-acetyltransferase [Apostasia shenzhenica]